jgi:dTDP-4-dehydrorhamnose reductase
MKPLAVVTGAGGLIGQYMVKTAYRWVPGWEIRGWSRANVDLTDFDAVDRLWSTLRPSAVVHCAALSRTKDCEHDPALARLVNVSVTEHLSKLAQNIPFLFLSSGEVFNGQKGWYTETDAATPINEYGRTKLCAEQSVLENPRHTVVRIVLTAGESTQKDRSFVEDMCRVARSGRECRLYTDEFRCPLPAGVIVRAIWELIQRERPGLYHLGGAERLSRWQIGELLLPWYPELKGCLVKGSARDHVGAPRPADLSLRCEAIENLLSFRLPGLSEWLRERASRGTDLWDYFAP